MIRDKFELNWKKDMGLRILYPLRFQRNRSKVSIIKPNRTTHLFVYANESGKIVNVKYKDPISGKSLVANIAYDSRGLPIFDNVAKFTTRLDTSLSTTGQMRAATRSLRDAIEKGVIPKSNFTSTQLEDIMDIFGIIMHKVHQIICS